MVKSVRVGARQRKTNSKERRKEKKGGRAGWTFVFRSFSFFCVNNNNNKQQQWPPFLSYLDLFGFLAGHDGWKGSDVHSSKVGGKEKKQEADKGSRDWGNNTTTEWQKQGRQDDKPLDAIDLR